MQKHILALVFIAIILLQTTCTITIAKAYQLTPKASGEQRSIQSSIRILSKQLEHSIRGLVNLDKALSKLDKASKYLDTVTRIILRRHGRLLDRIIEVLEDISGKHLRSKDRGVLKYIIIREYLSRILQQEFLARAVSQGHMKKITVKPIPLSTKNIRGQACSVYYTPLLDRVKALVPYPIEYWIQVLPDVVGGSGWTGIWYYNVDGGNNLYQIDVYYNTTTTIYVLHFKDEDHPNPFVDWFYDMIRQIIYGRIEDVETVYVKNNTVVFLDIWDNNKPYAYPIGQHGYMERPYTSQTVIYVSNVWNHAMDTLDKNPMLSKITWYKDW